jgi:putative ABC transport system permease protein
LTGNNWQNPVDIEGQPIATKPSERVVFPLRAVTPGYFALLGLSLKEGRDFRDSDKKNAPLVAIVNQAFADRYFAATTPIGRKLWTRGREEAPMEIVAVVENGRTDDLTRAAEPEIYAPLWQNGAYSKHLVVRSSADPRAVMSAVQGELRGVDPTVSVENIQTLEQIRDDSLASRSFAMQLLAGFSVIASVLTLVGIYGVLALSVAARRRELAIRAAVGAERSDIRNLVVRESLRLVCGGVVAGLLAALALAQLLRTFLYGVEPSDPATLLTVAAVFATAGLVATLVPVRRAMSVAPLEALRDD